MHKWNNWGVTLLVYIKLFNHGENIIGTMFVNSNNTKEYTYILLFHNALKHNISNLKNWKLVFENWSWNLIEIIYANLSMTIIYVHGSMKSSIQTFI